MDYLKRIIDLRVDSDLTQKKISEIIDYNTSNYSHIEAGRRLLQLKHLVKLSDYFSLSTDYLLGLNNEKRPSNLNTQYDKYMLAKNIKNLRKQKNYLQREVSDATNISRSLYSRIERGETETNIIQLINLAKFYNTSSDYLLDREK